HREIADFTAAVPGVAIACVPAANPTIFENHYTSGYRQQYLRARAAPLTVADVPVTWRSAPITLLGPVAAEVAADVASCLTSPLRAATPQGWLRGWDAQGRVSAILWADAEIVLPRLGALVCSVEDVATAAGTQPVEDLIADWAVRVPFLVVTDGPRGAMLYHYGADPIHVPAFPVPEVDPTGAGDAFAAAFLIAVQRGSDAFTAVRYAHAAASYVVAAPGISGIPTEEQIAARLASPAP